LVVERDGRAPEAVACPKQGILPHDMVHYAVESILAGRGFLSLVADGQSPGVAVDGDATSEAIERLVETVQAEMWGGRVPAEELLAVYAHACEARDHAAVPVSPSDVALIRARIDELSARWSAVPVGGALSLTFPNAGA
ncbi:MAG: hypothetical protein JNK30_22415, partial [Phenylobacterium sp.]|uniref:hypothetical protein n=1 Tax=Phenylobacterium sp. TaxID=1871053 RepID=UPI001A37B1D9